MTNTECFIHHHLGLGDHIICNGLVRYIVNKYKFNQAHLVTKKCNLNNVTRMFVDVAEIKPFVVENDSDFVNFFQTTKNKPLFRCGFEKCRNDIFDQSFYYSSNVPFIERWKSWNLKRDKNQERKIIQELNIKEDFIFIHDLSSVGEFPLDINSNLRQIKLTKLVSEKSIFDWLGVIEMAKEVHCINSSIIHLVNSYNFNNKKYYHTVKKNKLCDTTNFTLQNEWNIINYD